MSNTAERPSLEAGRLWAGGFATAVVAALIALVGVLVCDVLLDVGMVHPPLIPVGHSFALRYAVTAAVLALVATALAHLLLVSTPRPRSFFSWIVGLATLAGIVLPFTLTGTTAARLATACVNLVIGVAVLSLLRSVMTRTARLPHESGPARRRAA
jgi:hypothetical protein